MPTLRWAGSTAVREMHTLRPSLRRRVAPTAVPSGAHAITCVVEAAPSTSSSHPTAPPDTADHTPTAAATSAAPRARRTATPSSSGEAPPPPPPPPPLSPRDDDDDDNEDDGDAAATTTTRRAPAAVPPAAGRGHRLPPPTLPQPVPPCRCRHSSRSPAQGGAAMPLRPSSGATANDTVPACGGEAPVAAAAGAVAAIAAAAAAAAGPPAMLNEQGGGGEEGGRGGGGGRRWRGDLARAGRSKLVTTRQLHTARKGGEQRRARRVGQVRAMQIGRAHV